MERCREFRASIKKTRIEASLLVLDGGINFGVKDASDESTDLWRRLQNDDDDASSESEDEDTNANTKKRKHKVVDEEMEQVVEHERETRQALIEAEYALHTEKNKNEDAVKKSRDRARRITQQRAQLQRHRKEVEEAELEIQQIKDDIVSSNQLANTYEKECHRKKQNRQASGNNNGSYSNNFNPPHEASRSSSSANNNPYNQYRTPQTTGTVSSSSGGYQQQGSRGGGGVTNPYNKAGGRNSNPYVSNDNSRASINAKNRQSGQQRNNNNKNAPRGNNNAPQYASDMLHGITPEYGSQQQRDREVTQHPHRGRNIRNQRQFGTSVGVSIGDTGDEDETMSDELKECMAAFSNPASSTKNTRADGDDISDVSSESSDEDILSFDIFGKK